MTIAIALETRRPGIIPMVSGLPVPSRSDPRAGAVIIDQPRASTIDRLEADDEFARRKVAAVLAGDRDAFRALIERESSGVVRTCYRILGNLPDAEDAAQDAFVTAYRALGTWRGEGSFGAWLGRIAIRTAQRHARRREPARSLTWIEPPALDNLARDGAATSRSPQALAAGSGGHEDPALSALKTESAERIRSALAALEEPYREVLALRFFADLSLDEIARVSGRPLPTIKTQLRRGLLRLRDSMQGEQ
jgi:RNA polymerase sigma-70 factor (ECF subfamily)